MDKNIYDYIKAKEVEYEKPITLEEGWDWGMKKHLRRSFLYKHSQFEENNEDRHLRPNRNIIRPILNIQYRTEGFDVKNIELYVNNSDLFYKSFVIKKYHEKWAIKNFIDTLIDDIVESYVDYGGALVKDTDENRPEVVDLRTLAFCNQHNILDYPFAIKHSFSPARLRKMSNWGNVKGEISIEDLIVLTKDEKEIKVYEVHGEMSESWLNGGSDKKNVQQIQIVAFYKNEKKDDVGVTLFKHREPKLPFKFLPRDKVSNRALGFGGIEELFEPQIWTHYSDIQIMEMLELASKIFYKTSDPGFKTRNNLSENETGAVFVLQEGRDINQLDTTPRDIAVFNNFQDRMERHAERMGAASEGLLGGTPAPATPFKLFEAQIMEAKSMHLYRQGKVAVFVNEIYQDWSLKHIATEITNEQNFLSELSSDEMQSVIEAVIARKAFEIQNEKIINGEDAGDKELIKEGLRNEFLKGGSKRFIKILKGEMKDIELDVMTNVAGKQKDMALMTDKITNLVREFIKAPQLRQDPEMVKLLNQMLESSGMSPITFGAMPAMTETPLPIKGMAVETPIMSNA